MIVLPNKPFEFNYNGDRYKISPNGNIDYWSAYSKKWEACGDIPYFERMAAKINYAGPEYVAWLYALQNVINASQKHPADVF